MQTNRVILHIDGNCFYASVEASEDPTLRGKALAVCGDPLMRHGIVLAKSYEAKKYGIQTGMVTWQAKQLCPHLIIKVARFEKYIAYSERMFTSFRDYSPLVEPYGTDEGWLEITGPGITLRHGFILAEILRWRIKAELGITVSVGVSFTKTFAKLGSDYKKPDATTVITPDNYREIVWSLPVGDLLFVGTKTVQKLARHEIHTIGDLAKAETSFIDHLLGLNGIKLQLSARGEDDLPVRPAGVTDPAKSIGHSMTFPNDLQSIDEVVAGSYVLAEGVAARLRAASLESKCVHIGVRDVKLNCESCQRTLSSTTSLSGEIADMTMKLFRERYARMLPLRSMGIYCTTLSPAGAPAQMDLFGDRIRREKQLALEHAKDQIWRRFGAASLARGSVIAKDMARLSPIGADIIHPVPIYTGK